MSVRGRESELAVDCVVLMISAASEKFRAFNQPNCNWVSMSRFRLILRLCFDFFFKYRSRILKPGTRSLARSRTLYHFISL